MVQRNIRENAVNVASSIASLTATLPAGVEIRAPALSEAARVLTPAALSFVAKLHRAFESRRHDLLARRAARQGMDDCTAAERFAGPSRRDHRADRPQNGDQRAQLGRLHFYGGLRGRQLPDLGQHD